MSRAKLCLVCTLVSVLLVAAYACGQSTPAPKPSPTASPTAPPSPKATSAAPTTTPAKTTPAKTTAVSAPVSFAGKTISLVVPLSPGTGTDVLTRLYAKFLPKFLPGNPSVIVRNMPGAETTIGGNFVYDSRPDGLTLLSSAGSSQVPYILRMKAAKYDLSKMTAIISAGGGMVFYAKPGLVNKPEDLPNAKGLIFGYTSGSGSVMFIVSKELIGFPTEKIVLAYTGSGESRRAFIAGEINMSCDSTESYNANMTKEALKLLWQTGVLDPSGKVLREAGLPADLMTGNELAEKLTGKAPSGPGWEAYKAGLVIRSYGSVLFLPPNAPDNVVKTYWTAFENMMKDPESKDLIARSQGPEATWIIGETAEKGFKKSLVTDPKVVEYLRSILPKYGWSVD